MRRLKTAPEIDPTMERDAVLPPTPRELLIRWIKRAGVLALVASLLLHLSGGYLATLIRLGAGGVGDVGMSDEAGAPIGMALATETQLAEIAAAAGSPEALPTVPEETNAQPAMPLVEGGELNAPTLTSGGLSDLGSLTGSGDVTIDGGGGGALGGSGGGSGASFFGVEAGGTRFAMILDASGSMQGLRLQRLKRELSATIEGLAPDAQVSVILFSDTPRPLRKRVQWVDATAANKRELIAEVSLLTDQDLGPNTLVMPAFRLLFSQLRPRPDAIYLMTDGEFLDAVGSVPEEVALLNRAQERPVPIHTICFGDVRGEETMKRIARQSGGTYTFVPVD
jgi:uncharacterized protein YegL